MTAQHNERDSVLAVARELQEDGWAVIPEPKPDQLPLPLQRYRPDLIAERAGEHLLVEIKSLPAFRHTQLDTRGQLSQLAKAVSELPNWSFRLVWTGDDPGIASAEVTSRRAHEAVAVSTLSVEAGLLIAWSAVKGALASAIANQVPKPIQRTQMAGLRLLDMALDLDLIDDPEQAFLREAYKARTAVAHGATPPGIGQEIVERVSSWVQSFSARRTQAGPPPVESGPT